MQRKFSDDKVPSKLSFDPKRKLKLKVSMEKLYMSSIWEKEMLETCSKKGLQMMSKKLLS